MCSVFGALLIYILSGFAKAFRTLFGFWIHLFIYISDFCLHPPTQHSLFFFLPFCTPPPRLSLDFNLSLSTCLREHTHTCALSCRLSHYLLLADVKRCFAHLQEEIISSPCRTPVFIIFSPPLIRFLIRRGRSSVVNIRAHWKWRNWA